MNYVLTMSRICKLNLNKAVKNVTFSHLVGHGRNPKVMNISQTHFEVNSLRIWF